VRARRVGAWLLCESANLDRSRDAAFSGHRRLPANAIGLQIPPRQPIEILLYAPGIPVSEMLWDGNRWSRGGLWDWRRSPPRCRWRGRSRPRKGWNSWTTSP